MSAKRVAVNTVSQIAGKGASALSTFLITILLARATGAAGYGDITKVLTFVAFFYLFADFGLNAAYLQEQDSEVSGESPSPSWWSSLYTLRMVIAGFMVFIAVAFLAFLPSYGESGYTNAVKIGIILYAPTILFQSIITSANAIFQKHLRYEYSTLSVVCGSVVSLLLVFVATLLFLPQPLVTVGIVSMGVGAFVTAVVSLFLARKFTSIAFSWNVFQMKTLLARALPLGIMLLLDVVYFRADSIILTLSRSTEEVGLYGFAYKLFEFPLVIPTFFMNSVYPLMVVGGSRNSGAHMRSDVSRIFSLFRKSLFALLPLSVAVLCGIWFIAPYISLVKPEFAASTGLLRILSLGIPIFFASGVVLWTLIALKKQATLVFIYALGMAGNVCANLYFIPRYGAPAAAWITIASETVVLVLLSVLLVRSFRDAEAEQQK